jgi:hypothetical protein
MTIIAKDTKIRKMRNSIKDTNMLKIKTEYETTDRTFKELAKKHRIVYGTLRNIACKEGWQKKVAEAKSIINKIEESIINKITPKIEAEIVEFATSKATIRKKIIAKLLDKMDNSKKDEIQLKASEMLAKYVGLYLEDNTQKNALAGLSKDEINKLMRDKAASIGFIL